MVEADENYVVFALKVSKVKIENYFLFEGSRFFGHL